MATVIRMRELVRKYGKVALGVHVSVSAASITALYVAINNNVHVESVFQRFGVVIKNQNTETQFDSDGVVLPLDQNKRNPMAELAVSSGGALAMAILCNKALIPVRVPITIALTPPISRFLARRRIFGISL
ncbi:DUF1279 domain-containing protein [Heracleum sosnowskyi]|uniref:DUF1279 domain-containing protein n=1 Tax=Heracleum sosnowskyi TaxID=360622 RepID=A0AAD8MX63_9APIA|nr:DUF1279 domain-containing protein [Heracleum sosnowskyi]